MTALIIIAAMLAAAFAGWPVVGGLLSLAKPRNPRGPATAAPPTQVLRGGRIIGFLERAGVVLCIALDQQLAIAYIVAIKGLGRYPELKKTPAASERFIIGTLASMIFAAGVGIIARWLIGSL